jgi:hypothetical protein
MRALLKRRYRGFLPLAGSLAGALLGVIASLVWLVAELWGSQAGSRAPYGAWQSIVLPGFAVSGLIGGFVLSLALLLVLALLGRDRKGGRTPLAVWLSVGAVAGAAAGAIGSMVWLARERGPAHGPFDADVAWLLIVLPGLTIVGAIAGLLLSLALVLPSRLVYRR